MTTLHPRNTLLVLVLSLLVLCARCVNLNVSGEAITTRFWDCCEPSCGWKDKAPFDRPVLSCGIDDKPTGIDAGTGCNGGDAYLCSNQQPWSVNDTFSYGFAGVFITPDLTGGKIEDAWCCACYQVNFTSDPLQGKSMIVQASNTAYDINTANRFTLAVPGGNTTSHDACARQYGVDQTVFGSENAGVKSKEDCDRLPAPLQKGCKWRFDWYKDANYPSAKFKRVPCPSELTSITQCTRSDEKQLVDGSSSATTARSPSPRLLSLLLSMAVVASTV